MRRFSALLFLSLICSIGLKAEVSGDTDASREISLRDAPQELIEAWLRFHEMDLCQDLDTVFEFDESGMKVWCLIEDKKKYQKFQQLLEPLMDSYRIELCATVPPIKMKSDETNDPPPNLWENEKLRSYLGDLSSPVRLRSGIIDFTPADIEQITNIFDSDILKRLLIKFSSGISIWIDTQWTCPSWPAWRPIRVQRTT